MALIVIRENCKVHKRSWEGSHGPACHAACNKRELHINVTGKDVLAIIVMYINVPGKVVLAIIVIRKSCKAHKRS